MYKQKKYLLIGLGVIGALAIAIGAAVFAVTSPALAQSSPLANAFVGRQNDAPPGGLLQPGPGIPPGGKSPGAEASNTYLAEALGINVEQLQAAYQAAWQSGIDQALAQGLITEDQADWMKERGSAGRGRGGMLGDWLMQKNALDMNALLANELGISVEELQAAYEKAAEVSIQAAIDSGKMTEEQADLLRARQAFRGYLDPQALEAQALGITVTELQTAREAGKSMPDLLEEQGLTREEFQTAMQTAYEHALQQAVTDGVITQAQADLLMNESVGPGRGFMPGFGPRGGPHPNCPEGLDQPLPSPEGNS